jgi:chromosome partitioning protein
MLRLVLVWKKLIFLHIIFEHSADVKNVSCQPVLPMLRFIPSHIDLVAAEIELVDRDKREYMLQKALESLKINMTILL